MGGGVIDGREVVVVASPVPRKKPFMSVVLPSASITAETSLRTNPRDNVVTVVEKRA